MLASFWLNEFEIALSAGRHEINFKSQ